MFFTATAYAQKTPGKLMHWSIAAELPSINGQINSLGFAGPVAGVHHGKLIIGGGANFPDSMPWLGGKKKYYRDLFVFEKKGKDVTAIAIRSKLPLDIAYSANCSTSKGVVVAGGEDEQGISHRVFLLQWNDRVNDIVIDSLPELPVAVTNAAIVADGNKVYLAGGETTTGVSDQFIQLDLDNISRGWTSQPPVPRQLSHTVLLLQESKQGKFIYAAGGRRKNRSGISDLYSSLFEFDFQMKKWLEKRSLPYPLSAGTGVTSGSNQLLLFGGDKGKTFHPTEQLIVAINKETDESKRKELNAEKIQLQSSHPGFSNDVLLYDRQKDEWKAIDSIPFNVPVTTTAVKWNDDIILPSGEIKAGVRSPYILIGKCMDKR